MRNKKGIGLAIVCLLLAGAIIYLALSNNKISNPILINNTDNSTKGYCTTNSDCVPSSCCHVNSCTLKSGAPKCNNIFSGQ